ncbi:reverse transcriptase-like protein [Halobacillus yeomjeoni]|uniref:Reverse transcriptase-like protein n=1 Tax=Halobacillus yeomjeoni TaxID=311194 RepID=A0A931HS64_9BACI|nr:reverse transcriptase-like protein [Halobacillus yeomjeoni]MBH0228917.1 reverse transcriptase-like protein [Halobacillus yeomjeoni]MCA0983703.1 reverse transcriptase-like protein [Halobacillus yeomjeoni]
MKVSIEFTYKAPKGPKALFKSDEMPAAQAIMIAEDLEASGRGKEIIFYDRHEQSFRLKDLKKYLKGIETEPHNVTLYFDGGYDKATQKAGLGCAIYYDQNGKSYRLRRNTAVDELKSNNEAEYAALHLAVQELDLLGVHHLPVKIIGDSNVVINQLKDEWPVMKEELSDWADRIEAKLQELGLEPEFVLVSRKHNQETDRLATQALNGVDITSTIELNA